MALIWGGEDIISLAKEVINIAEDKNFEPFVPKGGVMDGQPLAADQVKAVSKWPSRKEQLSILSGQILERRREAFGSIAQQRQQVGEPDQEEERRRRRRRVSRPPSTITTLKQLTASFESAQRIHNNNQHSRDPVRER